MYLRFKRFSRYTLIGFSTFLFDLSLLWLLISLWKIYYLYAVAVSFLMAVSLNYFLSRKWVFKGSSRSPALGYLYFLKTALAGSAITVFLMWALASITSGPYLVLRIIVAALVGTGNYLINLYLNFRVAGNAL
jgi:putative flippase GtrA